MAVTLIRGYPVYISITWKDLRTAWEVPLMIAVAVGCFYVCYLISYWKHKTFTANVKKRRLTNKIN